MTTVLVRLDEQDDIADPRRLAGRADGPDLEIGLEVRVGFEEVDFEDVDSAVTLLGWDAAQ